MQRAFPLLLSMIVFMLAGMTQRACAQSSANSKPEIIAVKMHADWCGKCQKMAPILQKVKPKFAGGDVLFVRFDMTDTFTTEQSKLMADQMGLSDLFAKHKRRTGYMVLVDAQTKEELETLTSDQSAEELKQSIQALLQ